MSGHSKWSQIKRQKGKADQERGKIFSRIAREITVAARQGGGDPAGNSRLRLAIQKAKVANMPADNIQRAILKGTGGLEGATLEEITYEGYGPGGVAILVEAVTDNRNRTLSELRYIFSRNGGNLGEAGCVAWLFKKRGIITVGEVGEDKLLAEAVAAGAADVNWEEKTVTTLPEKLEGVRDLLKERGIPIVSAELTMEPQNTVKLKGAEAEQVLKLVNILEEQDDVQAVHANFDIPEEVLLAVGAG